MRKALELALQFIESNADSDSERELVATIKEALAQPKPKYRRGNRLICLETEEYCVIYISGTDRQWVKFPDSHIGVYTNEQVAELFELLPKEAEQDQDEVDIRSRLYQRIHELETQLARGEQEPVAWRFKTGTWWNREVHWRYVLSLNGTEGLLGLEPLYTTPPQRKPLTDKQLNIIGSRWHLNLLGADEKAELFAFARAIEAAHGIKE